MERSFINVAGLEGGTYFFILPKFNEENFRMGVLLFLIEQFGNYITFDDIPNLVEIARKQEIKEGKYEIEYKSHSTDFFIESLV